MGSDRMALLWPVMRLFSSLLFCDDLPRKKSKRRDMMLWPITSSFHINLLSKHDNFMQKTPF